MDKWLIWGVLALSGIAVLAMLAVGVRRTGLTREESIVWETRVSRKSHFAVLFHWKLCLIYFGEMIFLHSLIYRVFEPHILPKMLSSNFALIEAKFFMACVIFLCAAVMVLLHLAVLIPIMRRILTRIPPETNGNEKEPPSVASAAKKALTKTHPPSNHSKDYIT